MAASDTFEGYAEGLGSPARGGVAVTPDDTDELDKVTRAVWVGSTGNMAVLMADGSTLTFNSIPAGTWLPIRVRRVNSTGTTASNIVALH